MLNDGTCFEQALGFRINGLSCSNRVVNLFLTLVSRRVKLLNSFAVFVKNVCYGMNVCNHLFNSGRSLCNIGSLCFDTLVQNRDV